MAQRVTPAVSTVRPHDHLHHKDTIQAIRKPKIEAGCICGCYPNCDFALPVFADLSDDTNFYTNDKTDFLYQFQTLALVQASLIKMDADGNVLETITITDNTYGMYYSFGTLNPGMFGFIVEWFKVASLKGYGFYKINITATNFVPTEIFNQDSPTFRLLPYSCEDVHRTVKISTQQTGYFEGGFNYTGLDYELPLPTGTVKVNYWPQEIRLFGYFKRVGWEYEVDNIVGSNREQIQVQSKTVRRYGLFLETIKTNVSNRVIEDMLQAGAVFISDYFVNAPEIYENVRVSLTDISDPTHINGNQNEFINFEFVDYQQNNVHRYK
jgi:hypothetical protein